ncbi:hypothetical protein Caci_4161 [Catenulispora acidiphila DSM 44928]|uniref:Uncharacterized protein n=1 Tax=Catenulispora acidiphila (strain DSM 44928 / JCM 14897 / NBRC 102108 / NRRL B-24433 / ID139908) TaxID=479433 RepID=C7QHY0_CATAD|nr:hypothetical protein Caci_4161 [Catenulispora acidiphila DSM 44928]
MIPQELHEEAGRQARDERTARDAARNPALPAHVMREMARRLA